MPRTVSVSVKVDTSGLRGLASDARRRTMTVRAVGAGARVVAKAAKPLAPRRAAHGGTLKRSLGSKAGKGRRGKTIAFAVVGPRKSVERTIPRGRKAVRVVPFFYAHLAEKGTRPHGLGGGRKHPGARPRPFLRPAWLRAAKVAKGTRRR
jgi:hypothetical protein